MADQDQIIVRPNGLALFDRTDASHIMAALMLCVASIALTGAFMFGIKEEARNAINWIMPTGSVIGLVAAALSMQAKPTQTKAWLVFGTLVLASAAALSAGVVSASTVLIAAGTFSAGFALALYILKTPKKVKVDDGRETQNNVIANAMFFDQIVEIDRHSKVLANKFGGFSEGSLLVERIHIADRPEFLLACSNALRTDQDVFVRMHGPSPTQFNDTEISIRTQSGLIMAAIRPATNALKNIEAQDATNELAHELRTPLAAMVGFADALAHDQTCTDDMRRTYPKLIASAGRSLLEMSDTILQPKNSNHQTMQVSLNSVVQECLVLLQPMAQQKSIAVFDRIPNLLGKKQVEGVAMRQILTNLISNAVKYSPPEASIELSASVAANGWTLKVTDNGNGLAPDDVARLGQKNFRSHKSSGTAGYGLGLSIVRRLVDKIGGTISFESRLEKGTQVTIAFPASNLFELTSLDHQLAKGSTHQPILLNAAGEKHAAA